MGKGDKRTRRGKIRRSTYGKHRKRKTATKKTTTKGTPAAA